MFFIGTQCITRSITTACCWDLD